MEGWQPPQYCGKLYLSVLKYISQDDRLDQESTEAREAPKSLKSWWKEDEQK